MYIAYTATGPIPATDTQERLAAQMILAASPSPARSSAFLAFSLSASGETNLAIYDVAGRLARDLVAQRQFYLFVDTR